MVTKAIKAAKTSQKDWARLRAVGPEIVTMARESFKKHGRGVVLLHLNGESAPRKRGACSLVLFGDDRAEPRQS